MSLRQLWVRVRALPEDSPLANALARARDEAAEAKKLDDLNNALSMFG